MALHLAPNPRRVGGGAALAAALLGLGLTLTVLPAFAAEEALEHGPSSASEGRPPDAALTSVEQDPSSDTGASDEAPRSPYGWSQIGYDFHYLLRRSTELDRRDWIHLATGAGTWAGLFVLREDIRDFVQDHRSESRDRFLQDARLVSRGVVAPGLALGAYLASLGTKNDRERETAVMLLESWAYSTVFSAGSFILASERPEDGTDVNVFDTDGHGISLDVALAASIVEPLRCQYLQVRPADRRAKRFWKRFGSVALYSATALTAYQRMVQDKHWAPDVYLGAVGGFAVGRTLCEAHGKRPRRQPAGRQLTVLPAPVPGGLGISVALELP